MKRIFVLLLALSLLLTCALAESDLAAQAISLVQRMDALAGNAAYRACISVSGGEMGRMVEEFAAGDHDQPRLVVAADIGGFTELMLEQVAASGAELDSVAREELVSKMSNAMVMQLVGSKGVNTLAAVNSMITGTIFAREGEEAQGVYILLYESATPAAVSWTARNGAVSMTAMFLPDDELAACQSAQAVEEWFAARDVPVVCTLAE